MESSVINLEALNSSLKTINALRSTVCEVFKFLGDGPSVAYGEEERDKFIKESQNRLASVTDRIRELEAACMLLSSPYPPNLGSSGLLSLDPAYEKTLLYSDLIKSHRWFNNVAEISSQANSLCTQNSLKRTHFSSLTPSEPTQKRPNGVNISQQMIDNTTAQLMRIFPDLQLQITKPFGASTVMIITVARTLKALIMLRGLVIDWVVVKGFEEKFSMENNELDMWSGSRFLVFQKITEHANAAMLHFYSPTLPEIAIRSFLTWLRSYSTLFTAQCCKCGNRLRDNMPPTWRDLRNLEAFHEYCKP
ncbi:hypothetical protein JTE90_025300 [Oedothorax gibbosus]|uniref:Mediator of RNA polymerase II transcription subunit 27 n=1 Tax=Oedothorax gibbosus TaxID=931172 RepID=A0AAV6V638_9ARAC|nr:hypothetical protein JTE90_025300 [Oedothorax gibbosus]